jgi:protein required for attachment to host cells
MRHLVVVADAARARIIEADDDLRAWREVDDLVHPEGRARARDLVTDAKVSSQAFPGGPRSGTESRDPHEEEDRRFAKVLATKLHEARVAGRYEHLVLVAPPKFLGRVREALDAPTARTVVASIDKDLTRAEVDDVLEAVRRELLAQG